ncbi:N-acetyltransferase family protein [Nocardiopsis sp. CA-288880]|uniref:GNAT family N-acetyltransferase n=1 Tax=Nocardiopsis sp. CA-288880 TaxID=3239995 RepID=UPI003D95ED98
MTVEIRPARRADTPGLFSLLHRTNPCRVLTEEVVLWRRLDHPSVEFEETVLIAVEEDGSVVGRIRAALRRGGEAAPGTGVSVLASTAALHLARDRGAERAYTGHHEDNAPMPAVNRRLGYEPVAAATVYSRTVGG